MNKTAASPLSPKITATHLDRLAYLYIRQSTPKQVERNRESQAYQYQLTQDLSELIPLLGMVKRTDDLPPLPILPNQKACSRHRSGLCPVSVPDLSANFP